MKPSDSAEALQLYLQAHVGNPDGAPLGVLISAAIQFYTTKPATGLSDNASSDMLLFQYGCYDWGDGESFEIDLTRQFIIAEETDDDAISQLHLTAYFEPDDELRKVGASNLWCKSPDEVSAFRGAVFETAALAAAMKRKSTKLQIDWVQV